MTNTSFLMSQCLYLLQGKNAMKGYQATEHTIYGMVKTFIPTTYSMLRSKPKKSKKIFVSNTTFLVFLLSTLLRQEKNIFTQCKFFALLNVSYIQAKKIYIINTTFLVSETSIIYRLKIQGKT